MVKKKESEVVSFRFETSSEKSEVLSMNRVKIVTIVLVVIFAIPIGLYFLVLSDVHMEAALEDKIEAEEESVTRVIKSITADIDYLEQNLFSKEKDIKVLYNGKELYYLENDKATKIDEKSKEKYIRIFDKMDCERINLWQQGSNDNIEEKHIEIFMGETATLVGRFNTSIIYAKRDPQAEYSEIIPNWYFCASFGSI